MSADTATNPAPILLAGGGHAHLGVLADWIENGPPAHGCVLVSRHPKTLYSGLVPGWISGDCALGDATIALTGLTGKAGATFIRGDVTAFDPHAKTVSLADGRKIAYDLLSLGTGGTGRARAALGEANAPLFDIRPMEAFVENYAKWRAAQAGQAGLAIAVIGGGAGGTELAFALRSGHGLAEQPQVVFITGEDGLLPGFPRGVRKHVAAALRQRGIEIITAEAQIADGRLTAGGEEIRQPDCIVTALGSGAPDWPRKAGIGTDSSGFVKVDAQHRSLSHPEIFAAGDIAQRTDRHLPHSGVHAVFAGPVLADNLRAVHKGTGKLRRYNARWNNLYLLSTGDGSAILTYGRFHAEGVWVWRLKRWIDLRWVKRFRKLAEGV
ncbi:FAD-dependent oxidoreductase [Altererythrobacter aquiaggeris]|uniref:FAD-dependent oxidoreductase n=1 Tax=Aestuarierythrobacter aquiaggeris TaxID=1898396 RepID=UPI00301B4CFF